MSSSGFSNANTGDKPADPYGAANADPKASLKEKVEALSKFAQNCKFGMMTTRDTSNGKLSSRCMAVAGQVRDLCLKVSSFAVTHVNLPSMVDALLSAAYVSLCTS